MQTSTHIGGRSEKPERDSLSLSDAHIERPAQVRPVDVHSAQPTQLMRLTERLLREPAPGNALSVREILDAGSLDGLRERYRNAGIRLDSAHRLEHHLRKEWQRAIDLALMTLERADASWWREFGPHRTTLQLPGTAPRTLVGITHTEAVPDDYKRTLAAEVGDSSKWLGEQNLRSALGPRLSLTEIPDHRLINWKIRAIGEGASAGFFTVLLIAPAGLARLGGYDLNAPERTDIERRLRLPPELYFDDYCGIPSFARLERRDTQGLPHRAHPRRSAYMTEFLRAYKPDQEYSFLCGGFHVAEMQYFARRPTRDNEVVDRARRDAELLTRDPDRFHAELRQLAQHQWRYTRTSYAAAAGVVAASICLGAFVR